MGFQMLIMRSHDDIFAWRSSCEVYAATRIAPQPTEAGLKTNPPA